MITKRKNTFRKDHTENCSTEIFVVNSVLKANPWTYKMTHLDGEKLLGSFHEKELLLSKL